MQSFWDLLSTASVVIALAMAAGLGLLRGVVVNLRERLKDLTAERDDLKAKRAEDQIRISDLETVVKIATGEVHWQAISDILEHHHKTSEHHHKAAEDHWKSEQAALEEIRNILRGGPSDQT